MRPAAGAFTVTGSGFALDDHLVSTLKTWRTRRVLGESYLDGEDLVFTWQDGRPVPPDHVTTAFRRLVTDFEVPRLTFHQLRHTHATLLLREGVPVHVVAKRFGHKGPSVTLSVYADAIPEDDDRAVTTFSTAVWGA